MPKILQPLLLPQLVEARRSQELRDVDLDPMSPSASSHTRNSSVSDLSVPVTPTFSLRGHSRYASSISSLDTVSPISKGSPSCAAPADHLVDDTYLGKRSLPDVKEESLERDEDHDMLDDRDPWDPRAGEADCWGSSALDVPRRCPTPAGSHLLMTGGEIAAQDHRTLRSLGATRLSLFVGPAFEYDLADGFIGESDCAGAPRLKRRRAGDSPLASVATRLGTRFPSFARRWRGRKISNGSSLDPAAQAIAPVRAKSSRASSLTSSLGRSFTGRDASALASPVDAGGLEVRNERPWPVTSTVDAMVEDEERHHDERQVTTPLLPPLMIPDSSDVGPEAQLQSPLQSPTVADFPDGSPGVYVAAELYGSPPDTGLPSPPLSTRPSISSLRRHRAGSLVPSSEIPGIRLADQDDEWSARLGHANFDIHPEPYRPDVFDTEACEQMRANWELARCNYLKHLARTGEHYGITSMTYRLTQEKWTEVDALWKARHEETVSRAEENGALAWSFRQRQHSVEPPTVMKLPSFNDPRSEGKFPKLGDGDIVGPMVQITHPPRSPPTRGRRATLVRFLRDVAFPSGRWLGRRASKERTPPL